MRNITPSKVVALLTLAKGSEPMQNGRVHQLSQQS